MFSSTFLNSVKKLGKKQKMSIDCTRILTVEKINLIFSSKTLLYLLARICLLCRKYRLLQFLSDQTFKANVKLKRVFLEDKSERYIVQQKEELTLMRNMKDSHISKRKSNLKRQISINQKESQKPRKFKLTNKSRSLKTAGGQI